MTTEPPQDATLVELIWIENEIECWIRFGRIAHERILDRRRRIVGFLPDSIFAVVRWRSNDHGTILSRIDILRAVRPGERYSTIVQVQPGGESLLRASGWVRVERVLRVIDSVEAQGVRTGECRAGVLAAYPCPADCGRAATSLHAGPPPGVAQAAAGRVVIRRPGLGAAILGAIAAMVLPGAVDAPPMLIWNASASVPVGLYRVSPTGVLHVGDIAVVTPPAPLATDLALRHALPKGVLLLKPIAALEGHTVCRQGKRIAVDGTVVGIARDSDSRGRPLPIWQGCRTLGPADVFLMNAAEPDSFDGRYFGALQVSSVVGRATPFWIPKEH